MSASSFYTYEDSDRALLVPLRAGCLDDNRGVLKCSAQLALPRQCQTPNMSERVLGKDPPACFIQ